MDIRDVAGNDSIKNIMNKKKSEIERDSRSTVAANLKEAKLAEIEAKQVTDMREQEAAKLVGESAAEREKTVGIANEKAAQEIKAEKKVTQEREMEVTRVSRVKQAEIDRDSQIIEAEQEKQVNITIAEGKLKAKTLESEGIKLEGEARASAEKAMQLAPVEAQIVLAKEIGSNSSYQSYLISIRGIEAAQLVGAEQAKALVSADLKIIANSGNPTEGVTKLMDLVTPKGGTSIAGMLEAFNQSEIGKSIISSMTKKQDEVSQ
jgi:flotillin